jgi:hypothetical protein
MDGGDDEVCTICPCLWIERVRSCVKHENSECHNAMDSVEIDSTGNDV